MPSMREQALQMRKRQKRDARAERRRLRRELPYDEHRYDGSDPDEP